MFDHRLKCFGKRTVNFWLRCIIYHLIRGLNDSDIGKARNADRF